MIQACQCGFKPLKKRKLRIEWNGKFIHGTPTHFCTSCRSVYLKPHVRSRLDQLHREAGDSLHWNYSPISKIPPMKLLTSAASRESQVAQP